MARSRAYRKVDQHVTAKISTQQPSTRSLQKIIFNDGDKEQTVDIDYDATVTGYYLTDKNGKGKWEVATWKDEESTTAPETTVPETTVSETTAPETTVPETTVSETTVPETTVSETTVPSEKNTVKFTNNKGWSKVYLYAWVDDKTHNAEWPGVELTEKSTNTLGEDQYTATFDKKYTKIIFNDGDKEQTVNIDYDATVTGYYLTDKNGEGKWEVATWKDEERHKKRPRLRFRNHRS